MLLRMNEAHVHYKKVAALKGVSISVAEGMVVTIIGSNGAGKTTTLRAISGLAQLSDGEIWFNNERIDGMAAEKIVGLGVAQVPEGRRLFPDLSVEENLCTGAFLRRNRKDIDADLEGVYDHFPRLRERRNQRARLLSGGEQQMVAIGRALMSDPKLLLLDEPSMGLSPIMVEEIVKIIEDISQRGVTIILVEQNAGLALELANYAYVLETGSLAIEGLAKELIQNEAVRQAYLGG